MQLILIVIGLLAVLWGTYLLLGSTPAGGPEPAAQSVLVPILERLIEALEAAVQHLEPHEEPDAASRTPTGEQRPEHIPERARTDRHAAVWRLADEGLTHQAIARQLGIGVGEVQTILGLRRLQP